LARGRLGRGARVLAVRRVAGALVVCRIGHVSPIYQQFWTQGNNGRASTKGAMSRSVPHSERMEAMTHAHETSRAIAIIGGGPRGVSLVERIGSRLAGAAACLTLHLIDDTQVGAGRIWRTDQDRELCMNTLAHAVTLFPDESVTMTGPVTPGPTLHDWGLLALYPATCGTRATDVARAYPAA